MASAKCKVHEGSDVKHVPDLTDLNPSQKERKVRNKDGKERGKKRQYLRERLELATWQMACHALTN